MSHKKKRRFATWADAEIAYDVANRMSSVLDIALTAMVKGAVHWIDGEQPRKIGLCKLEAAHGGVVILVEREMVGAQYLDEWIIRTQAQPAPTVGSLNMPEYRAWLDRQQLARKAKHEQSVVNNRLRAEAAGATRRPLPPVVDQDVRKY